MKVEVTKRSAESAVHAQTIADKQAEGSVPSPADCERAEQSNPVLQSFLHLQVR